MAPPNKKVKIPTSFDQHYVDNCFPEFKNSGINQLLLEDYELRKDGLDQFCKCLQDTEIERLEIKNCLVESGSMEILMSGIRNTNIRFIDLDFCQSLCREDTLSIFNGLRSSKLYHLGISTSVFQKVFHDFEEITCGFQDSDVKSFKVTILNRECVSLYTILDRILKCLKLTKFHFVLQSDQLKFIELAMINFKCSYITSFYLEHAAYRNKDVGQGLQYISDNLKHTNITCFKYKLLKDTTFKFRKVKVNFNRLENSQVTKFCLENVAMSDQGIISLFQVLPKTNVSHLKLHFTGESDNYPRNLFLTEIEETLMTFLNSSQKIKHFKMTFQLNLENLSLLRALKNSTIEYLDLSNNYIGVEAAKELVENLDKSHIKYLNLSENEIVGNKVSLLLESLPESSTTKIDLGQLTITDESSLKKIFKHHNLAYVNFIPNFDQLSGSFTQHLLNSKLSMLNIYRCFFNDFEFSSLVEFLKNSNVVNFELGYCNLEKKNYKVLAESLEFSKIAFLIIVDNFRGDGILELFFDVFKKTKLISFMWDSSSTRDLLHKLPNLLARVENTQITHLNRHFTSYDYSVKDLEFSYRGKGSVQKCLYNNWVQARKLVYLFKKITCINEKNQLEVNSETSHDVENCIFMIKTLKQIPGMISHIIHDEDVSFSREQIEFFVENICENFANVIPTNVDSTRLVEILRTVDQIDGLEDLVKGLLFHRPLYIIDEDLHILHPYVYKLLNKYGLPLYHKDIEPEKRNVIIEYFSKRLYDDDSQEVIDILIK